MKILFTTNVPSPYRVDFFNELGKNSELTVLFEKKKSTERGTAWNGYRFENFKGIILRGIDINTDTAFCPGIVKYVTDKSFDYVVCANAVSPTGIVAIEAMRVAGVSYWIEGDGGFVKSGKGLKEKIKRHIYTGAKGYFSTAKEHDKYYLYYGAEADRIHRYPFTSLHKKDILLVPPDRKEKSKLRKLLGIKEQFCIISVGRYSYLDGKGKGFDSLIRIAERTDNSIGFYIIADKPPEEFIRYKREKGEALENLHFVDFKKRDELFKYYRAADLFILLTKGEAWGLVINEAMANGLPVITTEKCIAGSELISNGNNGFIVKIGDEEEVLVRITELLSDKVKYDNFAQGCISTISRYSIEEMAKIHLDILGVKTD